jgi:Na+-transporting methylmalonyl-CoA/oxaloacetate decarboxylase gamma subunit
MKKYIKEMLLIVFFVAIMWILTTTSNAASISLIPSKTSAEAGENVNVTVSSDCVGRVNLTVSNGKISTNKVWIEGGAQSVTVTVGNSGTTTITASAQDGILSNNGVDVPISSITKTITINSNNNGNLNNNSSSNTQQQPQAKSNVATLANLGIKGQYDFTGFRAAKTSYSVTVPNEAESVEIYASKGQSGQKITGTGVKQLKEGTNAINVVVTAEDGTTTKTYTINIERKSAETTDDKEENTEEQPEETSTEEEETFGLKDLKIDGLELTPEFKTDVYEYSAELKEDKTSLELTTIATEENAEIEVTGNEDLKDGENIITVIVKEKDTDKTATYQITVNKISNEQNITDTAINKMQLSQNKIIVICAGVAVILLIIIILIVIIKKRKSTNNSEEYYYSELYSTDDKEEDLQEQIEEDYEEQPKKKKRSKGKRFK